MKAGVEKGVRIVSHVKIAVVVVVACNE